MMDESDWTELKTAFAELVDLDPSETAPRLDQLARSRPELATRLRSLLAVDADVDARLRSYEEAVCGNDEPEPDADPLDLVGRTVGHFQIEDVLGSGGMGVAYRARDTKLDRPVALKFLLPRYALDVAAKSLLLHEARAASALDHPNVCTVFEVGEAEPGLFFAMPAYTGETLRARLVREGALPPRDAVALTRQLLRGLAAAHAAGITHRDLKPGNLIITGDGTLKILDFGLATMRDIQSVVAGSTPGTTAYMSPEQLGAGETDHRTDLWSTGVVLHEMLTGTRPFGADHALATPWSILHEPAPAAGVSAELDAFVARLLRKAPADRFASADEALAALERIGRALEADARHRPRARTASIAAAALLLTTAGGVLWMRADPAAAPAPITASVAVLPFTDASLGRDQIHIAEGVAEEVLTALASLPDLRVPGRRSSFAPSVAAAPLAEIANRLGVDHVVEGSVERTGDHVRVEARLVHARTNETVWSRSIDRPFSDIATAQTEIVNGVASALLPVSVAAPVSRITSDAAAYELYLRGRFHWHRRTPHDVALALEFFRQATERDSLYGEPLAGMALAWAVLPALVGGPVELLDSAAAAATRALAVDPSLADAHAARGYARHWQWRWAEAEQELRRAIALDPSNSTAHQWYGEHLAKMGRGDEGERLLRRAIELDPLSLVAQNDLGIAMLLGRRHEEAIAQFRRVHEADPAFPPPILLMHRTWLVMGEAEAAADAGRRWAELTGQVDPAEIVTLARATTDASLRAAAHAILDAWERGDAPRWPDIALYRTLLGDVERAVDALEMALAARAPMLAHLEVVAWADPLRDNERFRAILRQLAFP